MIKASEFCVSVFDGTHESPKPTKEGYKLLTSKNILNGYIDSSDAYFISEQDYNSINERSKIYKWDILFSMIGTVGNICLITEEKLDFAIKNMGVFSTRNEEKAKWLYFYLKSPIVKRKIQNQLNGAVQKFLPLGWLRNLELPEYKEDHKRIVDLLWSIEEKINKNNSINLELESMTKTIYDYWFLQFEFPNEKRMPYKSSSGKMVWNEKLKREIPEGWEVLKLDDIVANTPSINSIKAPEYKSVGKYPIIDQAKEYISGRTDEEYCLFENTENCVVFGDVTTYFKFVNFPFAKGTDGTKIIQSKNNRIPALLLYYLIKDAKLPNIGFARHYMYLREIFVLIPSKKVCEMFSSATTSSMNLRKTLIEENYELTLLRDFLLPLLINGQVSFKGLDS